MNRIGMVVGVVGLIGLIGCVESTEEAGDHQGDKAQGVSMALQVDFIGGSDVAGFHYEIRACGESEILQEGTRDLEGMVLPGMIPEFTGSPFDMESRHVFSDYFTALEPGCYDVRATPVTIDGAVSEDCEMAEEMGVEVVGEETTEVLLISQCEGNPRGALDAVAAINHPPQLEEFGFHKFNRECDHVQVCATASDPDGDPFEFEWEKLEGPQLTSGISVDENASQCTGICEAGGQAQTQCIDLQLGVAGDYEFRLEVRDLRWVEDELVPYEDSKAYLEFPIYAGDSAEGESCQVDGAQ